MESNSGQCGPLCQHPACWETDWTKGARTKHTKINNYLQELLRLRSSTEATKPYVKTRGLPVLTVQSLVVEGQHHVGNNQLSTKTSTPSPSSLPPHPPQLHRVEVLLEAAKSSPSASTLSFSPVLIWRPGRHHVKLQSADTSLEQGMSDRRNVAMKTQHLMPPEMSGRGSRTKTRVPTSRPHSRLHADSLDFFHDMPPHIVNEILYQLHNDSSTTLTPHTSTHHSVDETTNFPDSSHIPASLLCNLSTGQLYSSMPGPCQREIHIPTTVTTSHPHIPTTVTTSHPHIPTTSHPDIQSISRGIGRRKATATLPPVQKKTSFSRQLSQSPLSVLHTTEPTALHKHQDHNLLTIHRALLPTTSFLQPSSVPPLHPPPSHSSRYPLGNPTVPRTPQQPSPDPLLAPYPPPCTRHGGPSGCQNTFLQVCPAHVHNTRLVTLHSWVDDTSEVPEVRKPWAPLLSPLSEETGPIHSPLGPKRGTATVHLPPLPTPPPPPDTPSFPLPTPPSYSTTCLSPDHMHMDAEIHGDQLVLEREGEQVVHPLRDTSQASMSGANMLTTGVGVANGIQAPPPTANDVS